MLFVIEVPWNDFIHEDIDVVPPSQKHVLQLPWIRITKYLIGSLEELLRLTDVFMRFPRFDSIKLVPKGKISDRLP
jgi:hypothetical protein